MGKREFTVDERFVEVKDERFAPTVLWRLGSDDCVFLWDRLLPEAASPLELHQLLRRKF